MTNYETLFKLKDKAALLDSDVDTSIANMHKLNKILSHLTKI